MRLLNSKTFIFYFRRAYLSSLSGILAGLAATIFLITLSWATETRDQNPSLIWALPLAGLFIGFIYARWGKEAQRGHNLIIDEIHDPKKIVPVKMAPLVLIGTILTHLFGGSAGREGTAVQMGASLSDQLGHFFKINPDDRKVLLAAGAGAGFGAAIGTPWAGVIFGMEAISIGPLQLFALFECLISSFVAYGLSKILGAPHSYFSVFTGDGFSFSTATSVVMAGVLFGIAARIFIFCTHLIERIFAKFCLTAQLRPFFGGIILIILYYFEHSYRYVGLGIPVIQNSLASTLGFRDPILKTAFTSLTIGSGFKGGEFVPLVFIGSTLGSALSIILPASVGLLSRIGFAAVFAGASNTPIACSIMAMEIFGVSIAPYALVACFTSYFVSGHSGIYKSQKVILKKQHRISHGLNSLKKLISKKRGNI